MKPKPFHFLKPAHEPALLERGCVEDQPQQLRRTDALESAQNHRTFRRAAADAPTPAHSRAPVQGRKARTCSGNTLLIAVTLSVAVTSVAAKPPNIVFPAEIVVWRYRKAYRNVEHVIGSS